MEVADEQHLEEDDRVDGWPARVTIERTALGPDEGEAGGAADQAQQVIVRDDTVQGEL
jgi:hypothetical protein